MTVPIEKLAIGRNMVEDAVQNDPHAALGRMLHEVFPIFLRPEIRINLEVVLRVVPVIGGGIKDRIQIQCIHTE